MIASAIIRLTKIRAAPALVLRALIVGLNFTVMLALAALLGLDVFGGLIMLWGATLIAATLISVGGPLCLLAGATRGAGLPVGDILRHMLIIPAFACLICGVLLMPLWPGLPWMVILMTAFGVNLLTCLASLMRGLGSLHLSMALRDAGPALALLCAALGVASGEAEAILIRAAICMGILAALAVIWCLRHPGCTAFLRHKTQGAIPSVAMWGTAVLGMGVAQVDIIIGGAFLTPEQIGLYAVLRRVANLVALPVSVATWVSAGPVSEAYTQRDPEALRQASLNGSLIAVVPGVVLFALGCAMIPALPWLTPAGTGGLTFAILLWGALGQVIFASGFTVATLCGLPHFAAAARMISMLVYLAATGLAGTMLSPALNAAAYVAGISFGSIMLWQMLRQRLALDTSAALLLRGKEGGWKLS
ncbi:lipopolysaccharide biosynthesis protein [Loktanella agnita]|uniref:lipopolysaccharide biosynthesis protein n=1 Tax=Loktanella agnita TaxID=287097 RepID=UPI003986E9E6